MIYSFIIAAGNQTRFKSNIPKALVKVKGRTLLDWNIEALSQVCNLSNIYVVCSHQNESYFKKVKCNKLVIDSGKGCGDAVLQALRAVKFHKGDTCFIQWGDSLQDPDLIRDITYHYTNKIVIPVVKEKKPYVQIKPSKGNKIKVLFSKYKDPITEGYHDLSLFYGDAIQLRDYLEKFAKKITKKGEYKHKHGNELTFLDVFNETSIKGEVFEVKKNSISFNTVEELNQLRFQGKM